jgi:hypothetical protein
MHALCIAQNTYTNCYKIEVNMIIVKELSAKTVFAGVELIKVGDLVYFENHGEEQQGIIKGFSEVMSGEDSEFRANVNFTSCHTEQGITKLVELQKLRLVPKALKEMC